MAVGDFNGDGRPDLAVANFGSGTVSVLMDTTAAGATTLSFAAQQTFAVGAGPISVAVGDFNGDGKPDLAVANHGSNTVSVLTGHDGGRRDHGRLRPPADLQRRLAALLGGGRRFQRRR